jgi:hypothetical protein
MTRRDAGAPPAGDLLRRVDHVGRPRREAAPEDAKNLSMAAPMIQLAGGLRRRGISRRRYRLPLKSLAETPRSPTISASNRPGILGLSREQGIHQAKSALCAGVALRRRFLEPSRGLCKVLTNTMAPGVDEAKCDVRLGCHTALNRGLIQPDPDSTFHWSFCDASSGCRLV